MSNDLKDTLEKFRPCLLFIELAGLLHDLGKLSADFLRYRKTWHFSPNGWNEDPHTKPLLDIEEINTVIDSSGFINIFSNDEIKKKIKSDFKQLTLSYVIKNHHNPDEQDNILLQIIKTADSSDAAIDRNNPLFSAEQCDRTKSGNAQDELIFKSNVYGFESLDTLIDFSEVEKSRRETTNFLDKKLKEYFAYLFFSSKNHKNQIIKLRKEIFEKTRERFSVTVSDTTRPSNDTTLWEHCYAVATLAKVFLARLVIYPTALINWLDKRKKEKPFKIKRDFAILGIGWHGLRFISLGHKIGDITGRTELIHRLQDKIQELIECQIPIGNMIYKDINGIYFIIPPLINTSGKENYEKLLDAINKKVSEICVNESEGELCPHFGIEEDTEFATRIVSVITEIKQKYSIPYIYDVNQHVGKLTHYIEDNHPLCPVCKKRTIKFPDMDICDICLKRRQTNSLNPGKSYEKQTIFVEEIADRNERVALIVACFGLERWLKGDMIRSVFVSPVHMMEKEIEDLGNSAQFRHEELKIKEFLRQKYPAKHSEYCYERIRQEVELCKRAGSDSASIDEKEYAKNVLFLYAQRIAGGSINKDVKRAYNNWQDQLESAKKEHEDVLSGATVDENDILINILLAKTPTPSTVFDAWLSTERFFKEIAGLGGDKKGVQAFLRQKQRPKLKVKLICSEEGLQSNIYIGATYDAWIDKEKAELVFINEEKTECWVIGKEYDERCERDWKNKQVTIMTTLKDKSRARLTFEILEVEKSNSFYPYRTIAISPAIFLVLVPADKAIKISQFIHKEYARQFGKVTGRLPISVGNIFFHKKMPMFVVLDAARRMISNFEQLHQKAISLIVKEHTPNWQIRATQEIDLLLEDKDTKQTIKWKLPLRLADCQMDYFHPYMMFQEQSPNLNGEDVMRRKSYLPAVDGSPLVHFSDIKKRDLLISHPNYYDYMFLDSTTRRFDLYLNSDRRKNTNPLEYPKPMFLEKLEEIELLWSYLRSLPDLTDTALRNIESLLREKPAQLNCLADSVITKGLGVKKSSMLFNPFYNAIKNGLFFDCLELYLRILKQRIGKEEKDAI
ncbi:MAG: CRISPR-associated protein Csx11 [Deltaproteobacteria bacterium]|nr:MAG: CRISPR-associated protein Csx11 [Deltaproteobacteria bacterium]